MFLVLTLLACTGNTDDSGATTSDAPAVSWLSPSNGATVTAGDVPCSTVVENFVLTSPAKHNEGEPEGYISVSVDDSEVTTSSSTNFTITLAAGDHSLMAALYYADGDEVIADSHGVCEEGSTDSGCMPVMGMIDVTAE